ncbi:MAG: chromosome segregation protein SMC [Thermoproteota archaeon]|nr:chromosome segregation protein SMC [Thermoproteota archaeon]
MPYIKKIELRGFKSFGPDNVRITLDKGFTVITGPNGGGKSNIVDAVLFALGELSTRRMRAGSLKSLIFHGSPHAKVKKTKFARVLMQFDNSDGRIPVETSTVTISRAVSEDGKSTYRLNGRRSSRSHIQDVLSMAGIGSTGHNVVLQGAITRMAEVSSTDRRKIVEDLIGIGQYDAEKADAEEKLRAAEISIRMAMGRIDEVQKRVDTLERERNELLHYQFIQNEVKKFEAVKLFHQISQIERKIANLSSKIEEIRSRVEKLRELREELRLQRHDTEKKWRMLSGEIVEEGGSRVAKIQIEIGGLKSKIVELTSKINAGTASVEGLIKVQENNLQQLEMIRKEIAENRKRVQKLKRTRKHMLTEIQLKQSQEEYLAEKAAQLWQDLDKNSEEIQGIEEQLDKLSQKLIRLKSDFAQNRTTIPILSKRLNELKKRKEKFMSTLDELKKSQDDLKEVQKEQKRQLKGFQKALEKKILEKKAVEQEIRQAGKIADSAREAVVEFVAQREMAEKVAAEEKALRNIEELVELGVISGVHGRLRNLIKIDNRYRQAVEAAAAGWLDSLVVRDFDAAFTCAETLKRLKLGRIKIIPLQELSNLQSSQAPEIDGINGSAAALVKCTRKYEPAITFVFGDTAVAMDDKTALTVSREGYRTVTLDGNLYEAGGGLEGGYYRAPINFSAIIPSEAAIKSLDQAVDALRKHLTTRGAHLTSFEEEIDETRVKIARLPKTVTTLEDEINRVGRNIKSTRRNIRRIDKRVKNFRELLEKKQTEKNLQKAERKAVAKQMWKLRSQLAALRRKTDPVQIQKMEVQRNKLSEETIGLRQELVSVKTELSTLQSKYDNVLRLARKNIKVQLRKVENQLAREKREVKEALEHKEHLKEVVSKLEKEREELSHTVLYAKDESKKFTTKIDSIDEKLDKINKEYEQADQIYNQLKLDVQTSQFRLEQHQSRLRELGYEKPLKVTRKQLERAEVSLKMMRLEQERLGAVNQLALSHYREQASRYKQLSLRMNKLEQEKQAILSFVDKVEKEKHRVFMGAFNRINEDFSKYFAKLTAGGEAVLKLETPENPFSGGIDMMVQFPGKPFILVNGASGGERSVAATAFLFALQDFTPASFYLLDEIDAHLDALYVGKLSELLVEDAEKAQFIVITLKPEMVEKAGKVYGVYEQNGVSHVVSAALQEAA